MSDDIVIRAEGLGKKYLIGHQAERERYSALRDVAARGLRSLWRKSADLARGRALIGGDTVEEFWALREVDFEVRRGEVLGVIGRNGAGKSTLLKILSRITEPSAGRVTLKGRVASLLEVGTGFHPELTGRENILLNGAILGMSRAEIRGKFDEIVSFAEVEKFLDTPVKRYSSGMHVRLAFAVAAHLEPEILLVDEVLAVGDTEFQKKCLGKMSEVAGAGRTVLFVSHNMGAVGNLCPRCLLLAGGQLLKDGASAQVIAEYMNAGLSNNRATDTARISNRTSLVEIKIVGNYVDGNCVFWSNDVILQFLYRAEQIPDLELSFAVLDQLGRKVFYSTLRHPYADSPTADLFIARAKIPGRFLAPGTYSTTVTLHRPNVCIYDRSVDATFIIIIGDDPEHYRYGSADIGVVTVNLDWAVERHEPFGNA